MHVGIRSLDPSAVAARQQEADPGEPGVAGAWIIEELPPAPRPQSPITARDRRIVLALALGGVLIATGFVGHWLDQGVPTGAAAAHTPSAAVVSAPTQAAALPVTSLAPDSSSAPHASAAPRAESAALALRSPEDGATIQGAVIPVSVLARRAVGTVHVAVVLAHGATGADTELGSADVQVEAAGTVATRVAVFAPPVSLPVELVVSSRGRTAEPVTLRRKLTLQPAGPVQLWRSEVTWSGDAWVLAVAGAAPLAIPSLQVRVSSPAGALLAERRVVNGGSEGAPPGSSGGHALGLGSFGARLPLPSAQAGDVLTLRLAWRDVVLDEAGSTTVQVPVPGPELQPCPTPTVPSGIAVAPTAPTSETGPVQSIPLGDQPTWCRYARRR